jgi:hypothetical protein
MPKSSPSRTSSSLYPDIDLSRRYLTLLIHNIPSLELQPHTTWALPSPILSHACAQLILPILRCGVGLVRAHSLLRVCGGGVWWPLSSASGRGQGRLGLGGLSRQTTTVLVPFTFPHRDQRLAWILVGYKELTDKCSSLRGPPRHTGFFAYL